MSTALPLPVFLVTQIHVHDAAAMIRYAEGALALVETFDGQPLGDSFAGLHVIEGHWDADLVTLQRWPSLERFHDFYDSPQYRPWRDLRHGAADSRLALLEGPPGGTWHNATWRGRGD